MIWTFSVRRRSTRRLLLIPYLRLFVRRVSHESIADAKLLTTHDLEWLARRGAPPIWADEPYEDACARKAEWIHGLGEIFTSETNKVR
jgi:hypothetical protein